MITVNTVIEGNGDIITGFALGMMSGFLTVANGTACGYSFRLWDYGLEKTNPKPLDALARRLSKFVCLTTTSLAGVLVFAAMRTRSNDGDHHGIFSFDQVGFFDTFNDGLNLATASVGVLSFGFSFWKGRHGISDASPVKAEVAHLKLEDIDIDARDATFEAQEEADELRDSAQKVLLLSSPLEEDENAIRGGIIELKTVVEAAKEAVKLFAQKEYDKECFIEGRDVGMPVLELAAFDQVLDGIEVPPRTYPNQDLYDAVTAAHTSVIARISQSYTDYQADVISFRFPPPN